MGEGASRGDEAGTADRVLMLRPGRGIEGTAAFGARSGLCVCVREGGRGDRDGAGLRAAFLEGARDGVGLTSRAFAAAPDGRLRGKNMDIGLRVDVDAFEEGRGTVLSGGGRGLVSLERFGGGGQTWSPSWSRGTGCVQEEHFTVGRRWEMGSVGGLEASWAMIDNKQKERSGWNVEGNRKDEGASLRPAWLESKNAPSFRLAQLKNNTATLSCGAIQSNNINLHITQQ